MIIFLILELPIGLHGNLEYNAKAVVYTVDQKVYLKLSCSIVPICGLVFHCLSVSLILEYK